MKLISTSIFKAALLCSACTLTPMVPINAGTTPDEFEVDGINYFGLTPTTVAVGEGYYEGDIIIPEQVEFEGETYTVTEIGERAFQDSEITTIELPETLEKIGDWAFLDSWNLTEIYIPDSVTSIGFYAFGCCYDLETAHLPEGLTIIDEELFRDDFSLISINIPDSVTEIREDAFYGCDALEDVILPSSLNFIGDYAFADCSSITSLVFPEGLEELGYSAFQGCNKLSYVKLPSTLRIITAAAFYSCKALTEIEIPAAVEEIGGAAFNYCDNLRSVKVLATTPPSLARQTAFGDLTYNSGTLTVPQGCKEVYEQAEFWSLFSNIQENNLTGITTYASDPSLTPAYTLDGKKIESLCDHKGLYIQNGQLLKGNRK